MLKQLNKPLIALALAGLAMNAHAHRPWMVPSSTMVESKDAWVTVDAAVSEGLFEIDHQPLRLDALVVTGPDGATVAPANVVTGRLRSVFDVKMEKPGTYKAAIVSQNGNGYEVGLSDGWADARKAWADPSPANRAALAKFNSLEMTRWQYTEGVKDVSEIAPEGYQLAAAATERIGVEHQIDLLVDYRNNIKQYAQLHEYFRQYQPPTLAIWGRNDPFFLPAGAEAFKGDNPKAEVRFLDTGHFAIETHGAEIADAMLDFLGRGLKH